MESQAAAPRPLRPNTLRTFAGQRRVDSSEYSFCDTIITGAGDSPIISCNAPQPAVHRRRHLGVVQRVTDQRHLVRRALEDDSVVLVGRDGLLEPPFAAEG